MACKIRIKVKKKKYIRGDNTTMKYTSIIIPFVGGLGMFIYGMQIMAQGLENAAGNRMKSLLEALTKNKFFGVLLGAFITAVIQSSSATTVMVVGFVNAGIMNLQQAMGVIMGANIGTTVTGWLVSSVEWAKFLSPSNLAPVAIMIGVIIMLTGKRRSTKDIASIVVGFGLLFVGISSMSSAVEPLKDNAAFCNIFVSLGHNPFLGIVAGAAVTAIIQSSSASVGILQSLSSVGAKKNAKTAALMHLIFNIIGTIIFSIIAIAYLSIVNPAWAQGNITQTQISMVHTVFNIVTTVLLFPVSDWIIKLAKKIGHVEEEVQDESVVLLDDRMLETPGIAIQSTVSELVRMGHVVADSLEVARKVMFERKEEQIAFLKEEESKVDRLSAGITSYAIKLSTLQINEREHEEVAHMLQIVSDMERISDYCENISEFAESLLEKQVDFSEVGVEHLNKMLDVCIASYLYALEAFESNDRESALKTIEKETEADGLEISLRAKHIKRLTNQQCNTEAGVVFLDSLVCLERISDHARNIAEEVLAE